MTEKRESLSAAVPWKVRMSLSLLGNVTDISRRSNGTINRSLLKVFDVTSKTPPRSDKDVRVSDVTIDPTRKLWFRLFEPVQQIPIDSSLPVLIFFHGGAFSFLSPDSKVYDAVCRRFAMQIPAVVVSVNYRLAPEHRCPAPYDDGFDVLKFLDEKKCDEFPESVDLTRCFLAGDSAGGNLAHHLARRVAEVGFNHLKVIGLIAIQPFFGGEERTESELRLKTGPLINLERTDWHWKAFLPEGSDRDHEVVNVFGPKSLDLRNLKNFPTTLVFVGGFDPLQDWQRRYYEGLKKSGKEVRLVEYQNAIHAFYLFPELPEASMLFTEVIKFINSSGNAK